jgi:bacteriocin-like protein
MNDQEKKQDTTISPQPDAENKNESGELSEEELKKVSGGATGVKGDVTTEGHEKWIEINSF